ncbi:hypothetical protein ACL6C3_05820 [Capilliphycus salinus ALCB114379]|uniref:hypothetical protein n=1 Tax=Capilliphycus salinus TaxID=2768948 RepID=UPI0039A6AC1C
MIKLPLKKQIKPLLTIGLVNLILVLIGTEAVFFLFVLFTEKRIIYFQRQYILPKESLSFTELSQNQSKNESIIVRFHPFFGYVLKPGVYSHELSGLKVNNYGFFSPYDYPYIKTHSNQIIIGIFGGSVASDFSVNETIDPSHPRTLIQKIKSLPQFENKEIIVLNFANGGYKQPQQLLILSYFLSIGQEFDLVINIDGFNEIALSPFNNQAKLDVTLPSFQHFQPLISLVNGDLSAIISLGEMMKTQEKLSQINPKINQCNFGLCYAKNLIIKQHLSQNYQQQVSAFDRQQIRKQSTASNKENSLISIPKKSEVLEDKVAINQAVNNWVESSLMMSHLLSMRQIPYFHFIQPNQHYPTQRIFSSEEKRIIRESPYRQAAKNGYPLLIYQVEKMQKYGINLFNAVKILDETSETVYRDSCCHYNQLGQDILTDYVAQSILKNLNSSNNLN